MVRTHCLENNKNWDEATPLILSAAHETEQESHEFSPAELVFSYTVCGQLKLLKEQLLCTALTRQNLLAYISDFRE